ncbi:MAG: hypothetical protein HYX95_01495 [Chloroflexi bacterium]|nr:hypothetical protein [Chloroflexota bacterium]
MLHEEVCMPFITRDIYRRLAESRTPPCVSIYLPTQRVRPGNEEDSLRYKNLLRGVEGQLHAHLPKRQVEALVEQARSLWDREVATHPKDGLAVFVSPTLADRYQLPITPPTSALVADTFYTRPLLPLLLDDVVYYLLTISQGRVALYEGAHEALDEVHVPNLPANLTEALGKQVTARQVGSHSPQGRQGPAMFHGQGGAKDEEDIDLPRFFRAVDTPVAEHVNRSNIPVILCALAEHQTTYRRGSKMNNLLPRGIEREPQNTPVRTLMEEARKVIDSRREERLRHKLEAYHAGVGAGYCPTDLADIASAAVQGKVLDLFIEEGRRVPGRVDQATGEVRTLSEQQGPVTPDVLDDLSEMVFRQNGQVWLAPAERMPSATGAAAILRF